MGHSRLFIADGLTDSAGGLDAPVPPSLLGWPTASLKSLKTADRHKRPGPRDGGKVSVVNPSEHYAIINNQ